MAFAQEICHARRVVLVHLAAVGLEVELHLPNAAVLLDSEDYNGATGRTAMLIGVSTANARDRLVPFSSKLAFGVGQFAEGLKNTAFGLFVLFYYNQVLEMSGSLAGLALAIALIFDAITDPLAGSLSDNWKSRLGRRHPFMYASALPLALAFTGLFWPPSGVQALGEWGLFGWLTAVCDSHARRDDALPCAASGARRGDDGELQRAQPHRRLSAVLQQLGCGDGMAGRLRILLLGCQRRQHGGGELRAVRHRAGSDDGGDHLVFGLGYPEGGAIPIRAGAKAQAQSHRAALSRSLRWLLQPLLYLVVFGRLVVFVMAGVNGALDLYMLQYFWELQDSEKLGLGMASVVGLALGVFLVVPLLPIIGKRNGVLLGTAVWAICQVIPVAMRLLDWLPANGSTELFVTLFAFKFVQGLILQLAFVGFGSMMADVADEHEYNTGVRQEGIFFGAVAFSAKATSGVGTLLAGIGLDFINWPRGAHIRTAADVPVDTLINLGLFYGPVVAGFSIVSLWCYTHYNLSRERHAQIVAELNVRRQTQDVDEAFGAGAQQESLK